MLLFMFKQLKFIYCIYVDMIDSSITYSEMISCAAYNIYEWCDNVDGKYDSLPDYVKEDYQLSGYIPMNILPVIGSNKSGKPRV